jgi:hypothetical protein
MNTTVSATLDGLDAAVAGKVGEIIERQWGKSLADIQHLHLGRFYERRIQKNGQVSYQPTNRYVLRAQFRYAREPRQVTFTIA